MTKRKLKYVKKYSGLNLVVAAIILWNTVYLERAVNAMRAQGIKFDELLVSQDGFARIAILEMQGKLLSAFREVHVENASVTTFIWEGGRFAIEGINDVAHLLDP